jgi:hypothetical protein
VIVAVACETGQSVVALMDESLWSLLWTYSHLRETEERAALSRRQERVDAGILASMAFNQPQSLNDELAAVRDAVEEFERGPQESDTAMLRAAAEAMLARGEAHKAALLARGETPTVTVYS